MTLCILSLRLNGSSFKIKSHIQCFMSYLNKAREKEKEELLLDVGLETQGDDGASFKLRYTLFILYSFNHAA